jgi:hypothetical protein
MRAAPLIVATAACLASCGGQVDLDVSASNGFPFCSPSKGPLTAKEAVGVSDAMRCPPLNVGSYISASCSTSFSHLQGNPASDASGPEWGCVVEVPSGSTVGP